MFTIYACDQTQAMTTVLVSWFHVAHVEPMWRCRPCKEHPRPQTTTMPVCAAVTLYVAHVAHSC